MKLDQIRSIAKSLNLTPGKLGKADLIRSIQSREGNFDCYASAVNGECNQAECLWRTDCFEAAQRAEIV
ncbi:MAG: SAP domain-containing protein [Gallionellaceae bacterium]|jgi:hypothetical protein